MSEFLPDIGKEDSDYLKKPVSLPGKLDEEERAQWTRYNASVSDITPEFKAWLTNYILVEVSGQMPQMGGRSGRWLTADYKISALAATHLDPTGGTWYLCDGTPLPATETALIAAVGANAPDARGRNLTMKGTHADVNAVGKSDGVPVGSRRQAHKHTVTIQDGTELAANNSSVDTNSTSGGSGWGWVGPGVRVGPQTGSEPVDHPSYLVPGNLFIHS